MQLQIKNKKLSGEDTIIISPDIIIKLTSDIDCELIGVIQLSNGANNYFL